MEDQIREKRKEKWYEVMFTIEALAVQKEVVEQALKTHVEKMSKIRTLMVYETKYLDTIKVQKPVKDVDEAYSQVVKIKLFARDLEALLNVVMLYGPSSVEILGPEKTEIKISEVQKLSNIVAGMVHQFVSAGIGGIVISPEK